MEDTPSHERISVVPRLAEIIYRFEGSVFIDFFVHFSKPKLVAPLTVLHTHSFEGLGSGHQLIDHIRMQREGKHSARFKFRLMMPFCYDPSRSIARIDSYYARHCKL
jgi:hypothetical protein